jgi:alpha-tubulin suppressor-like RCC1 family protein
MNTPPVHTIAYLISAGTDYSCALTSAGGAKCWGDNDSGQLGDGTTSDHSIPEDVIGLTSGLVSISASYNHTCALTTSGKIKCWGDNYYGELGNGTTSDQTTPVDVRGLSDGAIDIAAGYSHTCALTTRGGVKCWGANEVGELGDGTIYNSRTPVDVIGLSSGVSAISVYESHTCALTADGEVKCWGDNYSGQLGNGTKKDSSIPVGVLGLSSGVNAISVGYDHACALTANGEVKCWGGNYAGQLGDGTTTDHLTPTNVLGLHGEASSISSGDESTCVSTMDGGVKCWGYNARGELGNGSTTNHSTPVDVQGLSSGIVGVSVGDSHTCAMTTANGYKCWGANDRGELGDGTTTHHFSPVNVQGLTSGVDAIFAGGSNTCSITSSGDIMCWWYNNHGELGDGTNLSRSTPVKVLGSFTGIMSISSNGNHTCAVMLGGNAKCWGENIHGELGNGTTTDSLVPVDVQGLSSGVISIKTGLEHTCALTSAGGVKCWGYNVYGQLGNGSNADSSTPVDVQGLTSGVSAISVGYSHACALTVDGKVKCWGENGNGQLADGSVTDRSIPVDAKDLNIGVRAISAGGSSTCIITNNNGLLCRGANGIDATYSGDTSKLTNDVLAVSAGGDHICAITTEGGVMCWGDNYSGKLGNGTHNQSSVPVDVQGLTSGVTAISAGEAHTCALTTTGGVKCWGNGEIGALGDHELWVPVDVIGLP